ncbi:hypothetical protein [uncultured Gemmiger sp.]|uniref:hypothetical protein n=1 Tax=uncultured Gemmiger sp. TaxID=1623490 RepID=UPI002665CE15|nr:hypothetical protein [uncultured Gemmiger sp.]
MKRVFSLALAALLLAGCTAAPTDSSASSSAVTAETSTAQEAESTAATPAPAAALRPLWLGDEKQYYMDEMVTGELIRYRVADLVNHVADVPCDVEGCAHDSESCPAVFRRGECDRVFVLDEDTLVYFGNNAFPETSDSPVVFVDRQCQNPRTVATVTDATFSALGYDNSTSPYTDGTYLYCLGYHGGYGGQTALFRIDPTTGETVDLLENVDVPIDLLLGAIDSKFVLIQFEQETPPGNSEEFTSAATQRIVHWLFDPATGALQQLASYDTPRGVLDSYTAEILDGTYYQVDWPAGTASTLDPETGEAHRFAENIPAEYREGNHWVDDKVGDWLAFSYPMVMINVKTGEVRQRPALPNNYWNGGAHQPSIHLNLGDTLLVDCRYEPYTRTDIGPDGTPATVETSKGYLGLISAEDFLNGVPNYTEVGEYTT